ncbi:MAG TPA: hypothetical protein VFV40_06510 [Nocardioides sp.]|nr:hypothetical protein [Nocardioides sp.]
MTPEEQEAVRRALAATPPVGPMPPEVVARLEATIADLAAARPSAGAPAEQTATVSDLEERRRRRWPRVLVAAASVAVLAYGVGTVLPDLEPQAETAATGSAEDSAADRELAEGDGDAGAAPLQPPGAVSDGPVLELRAATLQRDVARHLEQGRVAAQSGGPAALDSGDRYARGDGTCLLPALRPGDEVAAARLDGRRATLVVRRAQGATREAQVYWCGDGRTLLAETRIPARR